MEITFRVADGGLLHAAETQFKPDSSGWRKNFAALNPGKARLGAIEVAIPRRLGQSMRRFAEMKLLRCGSFAQPAHAFLQPLAQRRRRVGIKRDQVPERLTAITAQTR